MANRHKGSFPLFKGLDEISAETTNFEMPILIQGELKLAGSSLLGVTRWVAKR
jgi:hypothetical protein